MPATRSTFLPADKRFAIGSATGTAPEFCWRILCGHRFFHNSQPSAAIISRFSLYPLFLAPEFPLP
jgi:hypothetical protein